MSNETDTKPEAADDLGKSLLEDLLADIKPDLTIPSETRKGLVVEEVANRLQTRAGERTQTITSFFSDLAKVSDQAKPLMEALTKKSIVVIQEGKVAVDVFMQAKTPVARITNNGEAFLYNFVKPDEISNDPIGDMGIQKDPGYQINGYLDYCNQHRDGLWVRVASDGSKSASFPPLEIQLTQTLAKQAVEQFGQPIPEKTYPKSLHPDLESAIEQDRQSIKVNPNLAKVVESPLTALSAEAFKAQFVKSKQEIVNMILSASIPSEKSQDTSAF